MINSKNRRMSTPISELPSDIEEIEEDEPNFAYVPKKKKGKLGFIKKHKDLLYVFIAVLLASYVSIDSFRFSVPRQVFYFGDIPIHASIAVVIFVLIRLIGKNM